MIIHSDSTCGISSAGQSGTGPGQQRTRKIHGMVARLPREYQSAGISWAKGHAGMPGNERADALTGIEAVMVSWSPFTSLAHRTLRISQKFRKSKEEWDKDPHHHGTEELAKKVTHGPCHRSDGRADQDLSLALRGVPQKIEKEER
jgi:hypothetical protein